MKNCKRIYRKLWKIQDYKSVCTLIWSVFACAGPAVLHPCDGPHHSEGVCDGLLPHADQRTQPPGLQLPQEPLRHRGHQVSLTILLYLVLN